MSQLNAKGWLTVILINILISAVTTAIIVRLMTAQAGAVTIASAAAQANAPTRPPATATVIAQANPAQPATRPSATPPPASTPIPFAPTATTIAPVAAAPTSAPANASGQVSVRIASVNSAGQRQREVVTIVNEGGDAVNVENWVIQNSRGFSFKLPNITVFKDGFVNVYSTSGTNTPTDVFMRQNDSVWQTGDTITLVKDGQPISKFTIN